MRTIDSLAVFLLLAAPLAAKEFDAELGQVHRAVLTEKTKPQKIKTSFALANSIALDASKSAEQRLEAIATIKDGAKRPPIGPDGQPIVLDDAPVNALYGVAVDDRNSTELRTAAVGALREYPGTRAEDSLAALWLGANDKLPIKEVRDAAGRALVARGETDFFLWVWEPDSKQVRERRHEAMLVLVEAATPAAVDVMIEALLREADSVEIRRDAAVGLGKLSEEALAAPVPPSEVGYRFLKAGEPASKMVVNALKEGLTDPDLDQVRPASNHALGVINGRLKL